MADLMEKMERFAEAEAWTKKLSERYDEHAALTAFRRFDWDLGTFVAR